MVNNYLKEKHNLCVGQIIWNENGEAELNTIPPESNSNYNDYKLYNGYTVGTMNEQVKQFIKNNEFINAVKCVREATAFGLKESKDYADSYKNYGKFNINSLKASFPNLFV